ncbi:hypothetical protein L484_014125 [Morus notabilis]|uniref:Uncharacterized protein n=1 Tax=Morus notabilis TaxID=981085 RepID=W9RZR4_9ROSA|nr:hypothetical protein L484_014125 [Morus notabilis]
MGPTSKTGHIMMIASPSPKQRAKYAQEANEDHNHIRQPQPPPRRSRKTRTKGAQILNRITRFRFEGLPIGRREK